ncbi:MAG: MoaD/ThiS family protein [Chloroflexota bacterium]
MTRIRLEIQPWISNVLDNQAVGSLILDETIEEGATIGDLMRKLGSENQAFGDVMFDNDADKLSGNVIIVLNDRIVEALKGLETNMKDGDIVKLLPVIAGG